MLERIKEGFSNMSDWAKEYLLYAYFAGMAFFVMAWLFGQGFFGIGVMIGFVSALIIEPLLETAKKGNKAREIKDIFKFKFAKALLFSIFISYLIAVARYQLSIRFFDFNFEPISFGLVYALLHVLIINILRKLWAGIKMIKTKSIKS